MFGSAVVSRLRPPRARLLGPRGALAARCRRRVVAGRAARGSRVLRRAAHASPSLRRLLAKDGISACTPRSRRCCRSGPPASWRPCTPPACPRPTARTSPRWRRSRTPTRAPRSAPGWLNRLVGTDADALAAPGPGHGYGVGRPRSTGGEPVMSAGSVNSLGVAGDDAGESGFRRMGSLHTLWDSNTTTLGRSMKSTFGALASFQTVKNSPDEPAEGALPRQRPRPGAEGGLTRRQERRRGRRLTADQGDWDHHTDMGNVGGGPLVNNAACRADPWRPSSPTSARGPTRSP